MLINKMVNWQGLLIFIPSPFERSELHREHRKCSWCQWRPTALMHGCVCVCMRECVCVPVCVWVYSPQQWACCIHGKSVQKFSGNTTHRKSSPLHKRRWCSGGWSYNQHKQSVQDATLFPLHLQTDLCECMCVCVCVCVCSAAFSLT